MSRKKLTLDEYSALIMTVEAIGALSLSVKSLIGKTPPDDAELLLGAVGLASAIDVLKKRLPVVYHEEAQELAAVALDQLLNKLSKDGFGGLDFGSVFGDKV